MSSSFTPYHKFNYLGYIIPCITVKQSLKHLIERNAELLDIRLSRLCLNLLSSSSNVLLSNSTAQLPSILHFVVVRNLYYSILASGKKQLDKYHYANSLCPIMELLLSFPANEMNLHCSKISDRISKPMCLVNSSFMIWMQLCRMNIRF